MHLLLQKHLRPAAVSLLVFVSATFALAQTTSFTYQGRLSDGGTPASGTYDLQFTLWDALSGGTQQPQPAPVTVTRTSVLVTGGIFTVPLDFGATAFPGAARFLEISARLTGAPTFTTLSPRQQITSTPYAIRSLNASTADAVTVNGVPGGSGNYIQNATTPQPSANFNISGNGTAGGTLAANIVNATTQFNLNEVRILANPGSFNLFAGVNAGAANTNGGSNSFFGRDAGRSNTAGNTNSFFGTAAGRSNSTGGSNAFFGITAGITNTTGSENSFFGSAAGQDNSTGNFNAYFGSLAGQLQAAGDSNAYFGYGAGRSDLNSVSTGNANSFFGYFAGKGNVSGSNNTALGREANVGSGNLTNATAIGALARVDQSNSLVLGSIAGINNATSSVCGHRHHHPTKHIACEGRHADRSRR